MATPKERYKKARKAVRKHAEGGTFETDRRTDHFDPFVDPDDADRILEVMDAYDENNLVEQPPEGATTKAYGTLATYTHSLKKVAPHVALTDTDADQLNRLMQDIHSGDADGFKDGGLTKGTVRSYQQALRMFYKVYDDAGVNPDDIALYKKSNDDAVDPEDMLTREEIQDMRDAANCLRDRALFDFFLYTGQRNTATRSLRIKDLDLENGRFRLNSDADGLKGADENGTWRDLLLSTASIRQYLNTEHPAPDDGDAYVFVGRPKYADVDPYRMLDMATVSRIIRSMADRAAEECPSLESKPTHPHALRHNYVTIALNKGISEATIKHNIGHAPESDVMNTTYAHLSDDDHIRETRDAFDLEVEDDESELTPSVCPRCGENPPKDARVCPWCALPFTPDARENAEKKTTQAADAEDMELAQEIATAIREDPDALEEFLESVGE